MFRDPSRVSIWSAYVFMALLAVVVGCSPAQTGKDKDKKVETAAEAANRLGDDIPAPPQRTAPPEPQKIVLPVPGESTTPEPPQAETAKPAPSKPYVPTIDDEKTGAPEVRHSTGSPEGREPQAGGSKTRSAEGRGPEARSAEGRGPKT